MAVYMLCFYFIYFLLWMADAGHFVAGFSVVFVYISNAHGFCIIISGIIKLSPIFGACLFFTSVYSLHEGGAPSNTGHHIYSHPTTSQQMEVNNCYCCVVNIIKAHSTVDRWRSTIFFFFFFFVNSFLCISTFA